MSEFDVEELLAGAIDDYRTETLPQINRPGVVAAQASVKHRRRVRAAAMSVLALIAVAVPVTAYAAKDHDHHGPPLVAASRRPSSTPTVTPPVASTSSAFARSQHGGVMMTNARTTKIINAAINLPPWPGFAQLCPAGVAHFANGTATASRSNQTKYVLGYEYAATSFVSPVIYANLDGQSSDEALLTVHCIGDGSVEPAELLAVRVMPDGTVRTLGYVVTTPDHTIFDYDALTVRVENRTVQVEVLGDHTTDGGPIYPKQLRGYRYVNGGFAQINGPTSFPPAPANMADLDLWNTTIEFPLANCGDGCISYQITRLVIGKGTEPYVMRDGAQNVLYTITYQIVQEVPDGASATLLRVAQSGGGALSPSAVYQVSYVHGGRFQVIASQITSVGQDGITKILSVAGAGNTAQVTVDTAAGRQVYTYAEGAGGTWHREN